jgi:hypothetical protein
MPLWVTWYRYAPVKEQLSGSIGFKEIFVIIHQFILLLADFLVLSITIPIIYITQIRWEPVKMAIYEDDRHTLKSWKVHILALEALSLLALDLIVFPFSMFVFFSCYRSRPLYLFWKEEGKHLWHREILFHSVSIYNFFVICHDIFLLGLISNKPDFLLILKKFLLKPQLHASYCFL